MSVATIEGQFTLEQAAKHWGVPIHTAKSRLARLYRNGVVDKEPQHKGPPRVDAETFNSSRRRKNYSPRYATNVYWFKEES